MTVICYVAGIWNDRDEIGGGTIWLACSLNKEGLVLHGCMDTNSINLYIDHFSKNNCKYLAFMSIKARPFDN